ncbi:MAG: rod shape-determining protein MreC [Bdellovibrionota bacterium]
MAEFLRRHSLMLTAIALFLCSMQLMSLSVSNRSLSHSGIKFIDSVLVPLEKGYHEVLQSGKYVWNHYFYLLNVEAQRNELDKRVRELEALNSRLLEYDSENKRLRSILNFAEYSGYNGVVASVVGRDPSNWVKSVTIDRGTADGLRPGLAVVDGNAIVGQTTAVNAHSARVLLLTDNSSAIDALAQTSRAAGTAEGGFGRESLRLRYVLKIKEFQVNIGERVIASGMDGVFPKGSLIGVVSKVNPNSSGLFQEITVEPSVDVYRLENVLIVIPELSHATGQLDDGSSPTQGQQTAASGKSIPAAEGLQTAEEASRPAATSESKTH